LQSTQPYSSLNLTIGTLRRTILFIDGNKRTGFLVGILLLEMNSCRFTASEEDATQAVLGLAAGTLDETAFAAWLRSNTRISSLF
jgi:prophage maintenance system killer protein